MASKNIVFDVVGTLVSYDALYAAIEARLGDKLRSVGVKPDVFGYLWIEVAEREYTYASMSGHYIPFERALRGILPRTLWKVGVAEPETFASEAGLETIMQGYYDMALRPGAVECIRELRAAGFTVWCLTMGGVERVAAWFERAGVGMPGENLRSCDAGGVGKPDPQAYRPLLTELSARGGWPWSAAAHMWDASAAQRTGFRGAFCTVWEWYPLTDLFGEVEVIAQSLPELADQVIQAT